MLNVLQRAVFILPGVKLISGWAWRDNGASQAALGDVRQGEMSGCPGRLGYIGHPSGYVGMKVLTICLVRLG